MCKKAAALILTGLVVTGCDNSTTGTDSSANHPPSTVTMNPPDAVKGASLFAANCAACHGQEAMGTDQGPPLIHRIYQPSHHDDLSFYRAVSNGSRQHHWQFGDMPPIPGLSLEEVGHIIAWVRQQQRRVGIQ